MAMRTTRLITIIVPQTPARVICRGFIIALVLGLGALSMHRASALEAEKINAIETDMTDHICSSRDWLLCFGEDPNRCREIVHAFARPCLDQSLTGVVQKFDVQSALETGVSIITCFNKEFKARHPRGRQETEQCKELPDHLR